MRWFFIAFVAILISAVLLVQPASAALTFQVNGEILRMGTNNTAFGTCSPLYDSYTSYPTNHYVHMNCVADGVTYINTSLPTEYAAATWVYVTGAEPSWQTYRVALLSATKSVLYSYGPVDSAPAGSNHRIEVNITGSTARIYRDGILMATSAPLSQNPSYVGFGGTGYSGGGHLYWDDFTYGAESDKWAFGIPKENEFVILKDIITAAKRGVYYANESTLVSTYNLTTTWSKGVSNTSSVIGLYSTDNPTSPVCTFTTPAGTMTGTYLWPLDTCLFNNPNADYGYYYVSSPESTSQSREIVYKGTGAVVTFSADTFAAGDTATIDWTIETGPYWDTSLYSYKLKVQDAYGTVYEDYDLTERIGQTTHTFGQDDPQGTYYALLVMTRKSDGEEFWIGLDYATLEQYFNPHGIVMNESGTPITGASVILTQGTTTRSSITIADGNYSATGFTTGSSLLYNVTATGYQQYYAQFVPQIYGTKEINVTLVSSSIPTGGIGIGGVARDGSFDTLTSTITNGYGRPIPGTTVLVINTSTGESYTSSTNIAGWYFCDEGLSCVFQPLRPYDLWGQKTPGYGNSPNYTVIA